MSWPHGEPQLDLSKNTTRQLFVSNIWSKIKYFLYRIYLTFSFCYTGLETALHVWRIPPRFFLTPCTVADSNRAMNPGWLQSVLLKMTSSHHAKHSLCYSCVTCTLQHGLCNVKCALFFPCAFCGQPCPLCILYSLRCAFWVQDRGHASQVDIYERIFCQFDI